MPGFSFQQRSLRSLCSVLVLFISLRAMQGETASAPAQALTPPMGWNSWDAFGTTINESQFKANADWLSKHLKPYGWQYVVIDMEWFVKNPTPEGNSRTFEYSMDNYGRYVPPANRFKSAADGDGFKQLAAYAHSLGLKFGIHILRGIPKEAVQKNFPIADSPYRAADAAVISDTCPWNFDNYGVAPSKPAGQAYYDSIIKLYASWGVDLLKVDCISSRPYKADEIRSLSEAIGKSKRPILLSLSPGPAPIDKAEELKKYAQMWRISDDIWDIWHNDKPYPKGVGDQFEHTAAWAQISQSGHWPDADMLPLGRLGPAPGWGKSRNSRLTHDEQRTLITLWSIFRSPLMLGGDLPSMDSWTLSLLTNREVLDIDQHSKNSHQLLATGDTVIWSSQSELDKSIYLAFFNTSARKQHLHYRWKDLGLADAKHRIRDLWEGKDLPETDAIDCALGAHGTVLYKVFDEKLKQHRERLP